ncbi:MAG: hypothetical protein KR126chlam1_00937 [Chlamydiae bacterium]|nr:hypothetical protein [Chlamydiota bacterium]
MSFFLTLRSAFFSSSQAEIIEAVQPCTVGRIGEYILEKLPQYSVSNENFLASLRMRTAYHGTCASLLGDQLKDGKFEDRGRKVYFASKSTAARYALSKKAVYGGDPLVLVIRSKQKPKLNDITPDGMGRGLGLYSYFRTEDASVWIREVHRVEPLNLEGS